MKKQKHEKQIVEAVGEAHPQGEKGDSGNRGEEERCSQGIDPREGGACNRGKQRDCRCRKCKPGNPHQPALPRIRCLPNRANVSRSPSTFRPVATTTNVPA